MRRHCCGGGNGILISVSISSASSAVVKRPGKKVFDRDLSLSFWAGGNYSCSEREHRGRMIVCRIAVSEISANRRLAAHERIGDHFRGVGEYRESCFALTSDDSSSCSRARAPIFKWPSLSEM